MKVKSLRTALMVATVAAMSSTGAWAIVITPGNTPQTDENILFNEPGLIGSGNLVQGISNQSGFVVDFNSGENLETPAAGQARIEGPFNDLTIQLNEAGATFQTLILNLDVVNAGQQDGEVTFLVAFTNPDGIHLQTFDIEWNGNNFFTIVAGAGEKITAVGLTTTVDIAEVRQIRMGGFASEEEPPQEVPDGGTTAALLGLGLIGLAAFRRKS